MQMGRWRLYVVSSYLILGLFFGICRCCFLTFYIRSLFEDRYVEWAQFYLLIFASLFCFTLVRDAWRKNRRVRHSYALVGIFCLLVAAEEISWGQRLFGFESPAFFAHYNAQKETDFHNILGELLAKVIDYNYLIGLSGLAYGVALPMLASVSKACRAAVDTLHLAVPPRELIPGFLFGSTVLFVAHGNTEELGELFLYLSLFNLLLLKRHEATTTQANCKHTDCVWTAAKLPALILFLAVLSTVATDRRERPYGRGLTAYDRAYASEFSSHGLYREAVEQYEQALGIKPDLTDYSFLKNFSSAELEAPPFAKPDIGLLDIGGDARISVFAHPLSSITYELTLPGRSRLSFGVALDPEVWSAEKGDGVTFEIHLTIGGTADRITSVYIDPKHNVADRRWHDEEVDLSAYGGRKVRLSFVTTPGPNGNADYDWAWWGAPRLVPIAEATHR